MTAMAACGAAAPAAAPTSATTATQAPAAAVATVTTDPAAAKATSAPAAGGQFVVFQIDPGKTTATFTLTEVLLGRDNVVVGTTSKVSGVISVTADNPAASQIGPIQVDATDFKTDSDMRNGMIQRNILQTAQYQYVTFQATSIEGLPARVNTGAAIPVKINGNLTVRDQTRPVTFAGTVTMKSDSEIDGTLAAMIARNDFSLTIPKVPRVASTSDNVWLTLKFAATKR